MSSKDWTIFYWTGKNLHWIRFPSSKTEAEAEFRLTTISLLYWQPNTSQRDKITNKNLIWIVRRLWCLVPYMVRHHETSLTKEISSFLAPSHLQSLYSQLSPLPGLPLPPSSSTRTSPVSQVRTIFFTILSIATKSFLITKSIVILKVWKENQKTKSVSIIGGKLPLSGNF